jgi:UDP-N-acetylmuramoylalanine--D-glutamate ligase
MDVRGLRVTVFGMAKSGLATVELFSRRGAAVRAVDTKPAGEIAPVAARLDALKVPLLPQTPASIDACDIAILSPGVDPSQELFQAARAKGVRVTGDMEAASWFLRGRTIGITGSNGKTTTTALVGHLLQQCGIECQVGGNIGKPLGELVDDSHDGIWNVLEISSFQSEMFESFRIHIAAALNVTPDHLDRHKTIENYAAAKARIFLSQTSEDFAVLNAENGPTREYAKATKARVHWFNAGGVSRPGFWMSEGELIADGRPFMPAAEIRLRGRHNVENVLAGACAAHLAGAPLDGLRKAVGTFPGVEHRIEFVRSLDGVDYFNDSKATNVDATIKALESFQSGLWVILGGKDKNSDYAPLRPLLAQRAKAVLLIGAAAEKIESHLAGAVPAIRAGDIRAAILAARERAAAGDTVLLAPACASFDQFNGYEQRGRVFKEIVQSLDSAREGQQ